MPSPLITVPTSSCVASVVMSIIRAVGISASGFTFEEQAFKWDGEMWMIDFRLPPIKNRDIADEWKSFGVALQGRYGRFLFGDPSAKTPRGIATGTPLVNGASQSGNVLNVKGLTPSVTGIMKKGDYFQVGTGNNSRLHMLMEDANSNGSGNAQFVFEPALRYSPADNTAISLTDAKGVFRLTENTFSWSVEPGGIYRISFQAQEVVNG